MSLLLIITLVLPIWSLVFAIKRWLDLKVLSLTPLILTALILFIAPQLSVMMEEYVLIGKFNSKYSVYRDFLKNKDKATLQKIGPNSYKLPSQYIDLSSSGIVKIKNSDNQYIFKFSATRGTGYIYSKKKLAIEKLNELVGGHLVKVKEITDGWYFIKY